MTRTIAGGRPLRLSPPRLLLALALAALAVGALAAPQAQAAFGFSGLGFGFEEEQGVAAQLLPAGSHPFAMETTFALNTKPAPEWWREEGFDEELTEDQLKDLSVEEPPGLIGDPIAVPRCSMVDFLDIDEYNACPSDTVVGYIDAHMGFDAPRWEALPLYNLEPAYGEPARLGFLAAHTVPVTLRVALSQAGEPNVIVSSLETSKTVQILGGNVTIWGDPADPVHDPYRGACLSDEGYESPEVRPKDQLEIQRYEAYEHNGHIECSGAAIEEPFLTAPSSCPESLTANFSAESWQHPDPADRVYGSASTIGTSDCEDVEFTPQMSIKNTGEHADNPSGLSVGIQFDQTGLTSPVGRAQSEIRKAVVTLPEGLTINPAEANGLGSCTEAELEEIAPESEPGEGCPEASKIGTVEVETPLLEESLQGSVYLAKQRENRFGTLLALYMMVRNPNLGIIVRLAGKIEPDPVTGRLVATFDDLPQLPFSSFQMRLDEGPHAALITPNACGSYPARAELTPWSDPGTTLVRESTITVASGPGGGACKTSSFGPTLSAGSSDPIGGAYSPFTLRLERQDGTQRIAGLTTTLPKGLLARLAAVTYCPDSVLASVLTAEGTGAGWLTSPGCPASSQVGTVSVRAGAGPDPLQVDTGRAYLAGPYKGAPISLAIVTPAIAGPFDLGNVVVRTALQVNPETAQVTAVSDPIPTIVHGIPLDIRSLEVRLDRPGFTRNPTSCDVGAFTGTAISAMGSSAPLTDRFQVGGCSSLRFKPKLKLQVIGKTNRNAKPRLKAVLTTRPGEANIRRARVNLPHSEFLEQNHLNKTCTRPVLLEGHCPNSTIYGKAKAWTPLLEKPLQGNVYLVGGYGYKLPALVAELSGQIRVLLKGKVDSGRNGGIRNTFELVPDAPVSRFMLELKGGKKGILVNSEDLCSKKAKRNAIVRFVGQNGKAEQFKPTVATTCGKARKKRPPRRSAEFRPTSSPFP